MFEDTLLIIKSDYMNKRKAVLLKVLQQSFQIQAHRRVLFSPELAAEFYNHDESDKSNFMLRVIILCKGVSEAFILTKQNAVEELFKTMLCYFGNAEEMERNVHASKDVSAAPREIAFIFPNYIPEPMALFYESKFANSPLVKELMAEAYDLISGANGCPPNWKANLAEWLTLSNQLLPHVSHQCSRKVSRPTKEQLTAPSPTTRRSDPCATTPGTTASESRHSLSATSAGSSKMMTTSSCITCSCFDSGEACYRPLKEEEDSMEILVRARTTRLSEGASSSSSAEVEWQEIDEEESHESEQALEYGGNMEVPSARDTAPVVIDESPPEETTVGPELQPQPPPAPEAAEQIEQAEQVEQAPLAIVDETPSVIFVEETPPEPLVVSDASVIIVQELPPVVVVEDSEGPEAEKEPSVIFVGEVPPEVIVVEDDLERPLEETAAGPPAEDTATGPPAGETVGPPAEETAGPPAEVAEGPASEMAADPPAEEPQPAAAD